MCIFVRSYSKGSYGIPIYKGQDMSDVGLDNKKINAYLEIPKERIHDKVQHNKRRKYSIQNPHEDKPSSQPNGIQLSISDRIIEQAKYRDPPINQCRSVLLLQKYPPDFPRWIKQILHQTESQIPLQRPRQYPAFPLFSIIIHQPLHTPG